MRLAALLLALSAQAAYSEPPAPFAAPAIPAVTLWDEHGREVRLDHLLATTSEPIALQFVFTTCPGVCPTLTATLTALAGKVPNLRRLSISIDPEVDTPARLAEYEERFGASEAWTLLTGSRDDSIAVQQAFGAYRGDKMRHLPLTFLRPKGSASWVRFEGFPGIETLAEALVVRPPDPSRGRLLFEQGQTSPERPLEVALPSGAVLRGRAAACAGCHRESGAGGVEGGLYTPPVTARALFREEPPRRIDLYEELFQDELAPETWARLRQRSPRPAFGDATLARAIREGVEPTGRALDPRMPRYALSEAEVADLTAYLRTLGTADAPGVDEETLHFATVIMSPSESSDSERRERARLATTEAFFRWKNADTARLRQRPPDPLGHEDDFPPAYREWRLAVWPLGDDPASWRQDLAERYRAEPVFALIGDLSGASEGARHQLAAFCAEHEVPCLLLGGSSDAPANFERKFPSGACGETAVDREPPQAFRARQWLRARGIPPGPEERIQLATYSLLTVAEAAVLHLLDNFSRAVFLESIDRESGRMPSAVACPPTATKVAP